MLEYNLTQRERSILIQLLDLSKRTKDTFEAQIINADTAGPGSEVARLDFAASEDTSPQNDPSGPDTSRAETNAPAFMELTKRDLRVLKDEGLIHFRWDLPTHGTGRLTSLAFQAVDNDFRSTTIDSTLARSADLAIQAAAARKLLAAADLAAIDLRFQKITAELVVLVGKLIDADEAQSAHHEARAISAELQKPHPDESVLIRKIKGFVSRLSLTFSGTADLAAKGEAIGEFTERLAAWLVALSLWTDYHTAHPTLPPPTHKPV